jgi:hypothetical protein
MKLPNILLFAISFLIAALLGCQNQNPKQEPASPAAGTGTLILSENKRFLMFEDGRPFFYLGDTAWELFHRLDKEKADMYLEQRASLGFTVIQAVVLAEENGLIDPNPYGEVPLIDLDPAQPNEAYFKHVDYIIEKAEKLGLYIAVLPTWGDKWNKKWGKGPEIFTPENARAFGHYLGERYKESPNIIWVVGGDRPIENELHREIVEEMAWGLREGDQGNHLISFHPMGGESSSKYFHDAQWLDFNMWQTGHSTANNTSFNAIRNDYAKTPIKPIIDGEPIYEDHPNSFRKDEQGHSVAADVRRLLYWNLFGGAFGNTYGHHAVWQMWEEGRKPVNFPLMPWYEAINQPGAAQMQYGRWLIESRPFFTRIPADDVLAAHEVTPSAVPGAGAYRFAATRDTDGTYAMVYVPVGRSFKVNMDVIKGEDVMAWWYNPRNGHADNIGLFKNTGKQRFTPPNPGEHLDWILVLDDASKAYPKPGQR